MEEEYLPHIYRSHGKIHRTNVCERSHNTDMQSLILWQAQTLSCTKNYIRKEGGFKACNQFYVYYMKSCFDIFNK